jgi:hypothetical protein
MEKKVLPVESGNPFENELGNLRSLFQKENARKRKRSEAFFTLFKRLQKCKESNKKQKALNIAESKINVLTQASNMLQAQTLAEDPEVKLIEKQMDEEKQNSPVQHDLQDVQMQWTELLEIEKKNAAAIRDLLNEEKKVTARLRTEIEESKGRFKVPALPQWVYNIFAKDLTDHPDDIEKIIFDLFVYEDFLVLWEHRGETELTTLQQQFSRNPYKVDVKYFESVAYEKAKQLVNLLNLPDVKEILESPIPDDVNIQNVILDMYNTLQMQMTAYKTVLDALIQHKGLSQDYWDVKEKTYEGDILPVKDAETVKLLNRLLTRFKRELKEHKEFSSSEKNLAIKLKAKNWENTFYEQKNK